MKIRPFETEALRFFSAGSVPSLPGVPAVQAVRPLHGCFLLPVSQQYPQIPQIISRAPGQDRVTQPRKKRKCIASLKEISRIESRLLRTLERPAVCHRARPGAIAVNPVSPRTQHRHLLSRDFFHASQHERRIPSPNSVSRHRRAYFSIGNQSDAPPAMHHAQLRELPQQRFRRFLDRPFIGRVIATRHKTQCFRRVVRRMKQIVHSQCQRKGRFPEGPVASADSFPTGTSLTASVIFVASGAVAASRPPFTADKCFLTVLISSMLAPQVTSALCQCCTSSKVCFASSGSSISADPPPESRKITSVFASHFRSKARMASAAFQLCSFGVGCPAAKYFRPGTGFFGSEGAATAPAKPTKGASANTSPSTMA